MRIFFGLATTTILLIHSVGAVSFMMMPLLSRSFSFAFTSFFRALGIRLEVCCTGIADGVYYKAAGTNVSQSFEHNLIILQDTLGC